MNVGAVPANIIGTDGSMVPTETSIEGQVKLEHAGRREDDSLTGRSQSQGKRVPRRASTGQCNSHASLSPRRWVI